MQNPSREERQQRLQEVGADVGGFPGEQQRRGNVGTFTAGEIIAKDDKSVTIRVSDGGSKIVLLLRLNRNHKIGGWCLERS